MKGKATYISNQFHLLQKNAIHGNLFKVAIQACEAHHDDASFGGHAPEAGLDQADWVKHDVHASAPRHGIDLLPPFFIRGIVDALACAIALCILALVVGAGGTDDAAATRGRDLACHDTEAARGGVHEDRLARAQAAGGDEAVVGHGQRCGEPGSGLDGPALGDAQQRRDPRPREGNYFGVGTSVVAKDGITLLKLTVWRRGEDDAGKLEAEDERGSDMSLVILMLS